MKFPRNALWLLGISAFLAAATAPAATTTLIARGSFWNYLDNGTDQGTAWRNPAFDDSAWRSGRAQLGYGDGDEVTVVGYGPDPNAKYITTYFRARFVVTNAPQCTNLQANVLRDDGAVLYLNGTEVARQNMPSGTIMYTTPASTSIPPADEVTFFPATIDPRLLVNGTNVIAVEVHQNGPLTSDLSFDLELVGSFTTNAVPPSVTLSSPAPGGYYYSAARIHLAASATPALGSVTMVEFLSGDDVIGKALSSPYEFDWVNAPPGTHRLIARATDSLGQVGTSAPVTVYVLANDAPWPFIVDTGSIWKYLDTGTNLGTAWRAIDFDDSAWPSGPAQLGYGDGDEATVVSYGPSTTARYITTYFRRSFLVPADATYTNLYVRLLRDDGAIVYLNGSEIFRSNIGSGQPDYLTLALTAVGGASETAFYSRGADPALLIRGTNVLAVEIHQNAANSSDISFDLELAGNLAEPDTSLSIGPGQRGTIHCVDHPDIAYDLYLPPNYSSNGPALPLLYTFYANGGGMVPQFQNVAANLQIILIGILESQNGVDWPDYIDVLHGVTRDARQRLNYDPTAVFAAGWSGGAVAAYDFSKFLRQEIAGVFALSGWLEMRTASVDRYLTNLLVARANGSTDAAANYYLTNDALHLLQYGVIIRDWIFTGGHVVAPDSVKAECLNWLLGQRLLAGPTDQADAAARAAAWRAAIQNGERERVYRECLSAIMTHPRSYKARQALLVLDEVMAAFPDFRALDVAGAGDSDYALDHFYFGAFGAAKAHDRALYYSALKAATGITGTSGDRLFDFRNLLLSFGLPRPMMRGITATPSGEVVLTYAPDALVATYHCEQIPALGSDLWSLVVAPQTTNANGTISLLLPTPLPTTRFFRLGFIVP